MGVIPIGTGGFRCEFPTNHRTYIKIKWTAPFSLAVALPTRSVTPLADLESVEPALPVCLSGPTLAPSGVVESHRSWRRVAFCIRCILRPPGERSGRIGVTGTICLRHRESLRGALLFAAGALLFCSVGSPALCFNWDDCFAS